MRGALAVAPHVYLCLWLPRLVLTPRTPACGASSCVGYVYGDSTCGQRAVYQLGMTGVPVYNVSELCRASCSRRSSAAAVPRIITPGVSHVACVRR